MNNRSYAVTLYDKDDFEIETYWFDRKADQLAKYYGLVSIYGKARVEKLTYQR